jgi:hypothetical protein
VKGKVPSSQEGRQLGRKRKPPRGEGLAGRWWASGSALLNA